MTHGVQFPVPQFRHVVLGVVVFIIAFLTQGCSVVNWLFGLESYTVCSFGCPYERIAKAVEAAKEGDTVTIGPGTYTENIMIQKNLILKGAGSGKTVIKGVWYSQPVIRIVGISALQVTLQGLTIAGARMPCCENDGLYVRGNARVKAEDIQVIHNTGDGLEVLEGGTVDFEGGTISDNEGRGLYVGQKAEVNINSLVISNNGYDGIVADEKARVILKNSKVEKNGEADQCADSKEMCNGITLRSVAIVELENSTIRDNADWGVATWQIQCGYKQDLYSGGNVIFKDNVTIEGNNTSHNILFGNPGNHGWNRLWVAPGQVCLP